MRTGTVRAVIGGMTLAWLLSHFLGHAHAANPLGIGSSEAVIAPDGAFSGLMTWINAQQQAFYRSLTGALKTMREDGGSAWMMAGLSFAYGIFHAAGPGHGKAVISSYMLANEVALRRGVVLSFLSAFLQATTAVLVILTMLLVLRGTAISMADATRFLEISSYALISAFGAWLVWRKVSPLFGRAGGADGRHGPGAADPHHTVHDGAQGRHDHHLHGHGHHDHAGHDHSHAAGETCRSCGHVHMADPGLLGGERFNWRSAWTAIGAVGLRPCSGALIVLTFAFLNGLWLGGIASVLAMAIGTALTVSCLATLAVSAKTAAVALAGRNGMGSRVHTGIELAGAGFVLVLGLLLLTASLSA
jgi:nickel/cobalt exporter